MNTKNIHKRKFEKERQQNLSLQDESSQKETVRVEKWKRTCSLRAAFSVALALAPPQPSDTSFRMTCSQVLASLASVQQQIFTTKVHRKSVKPEWQKMLPSRAPVESRPGGSKVNFTGFVFTLAPHQEAVDRKKILTRVSQYSVSTGTTTISLTVLKCCGISVNTRRILCHFLWHINRSHERFDFSCWRYNTISVYNNNTIEFKRHCDVITQYCSKGHIWVPVHTVSLKLTGETV